MPANMQAEAPKLI